MRHRRWRQRKAKRRLWVGSFGSWNPMKWYSFVSGSKHPEPFSKRDGGTQRRAARRFKRKQREGLLCQSI